jgi:glycosyltransferase involved in cell wall biosynthesis
MRRPPFVTVVVPALDEAATLGLCLDALAAQDYPRDRHEVVVVDNGSTDGTAAVAAGRGVRVLREAKRSSYAARNAAVAATRGDHLAFTDADCVPCPGWLSELVRAEESRRTGVVAGRIAYELVRDTLGSRALVASRRPEDLRARVVEQHCAPTGNVMIRRELLERHGAFREVVSGSDVELSRRMARLGHPPAYAERAVVVHRCDLSSGEYLRRSFRVAYGQALHSAAPALRQALRDTARVAWRPGFRAGAPLRAVEPTSGAPSAPVAWFYAWAARHASYAGRCCGSWVRWARGGVPAARIDVRPLAQAERA